MQALNSQIPSNNLSLDEIRKNIVDEMEKGKESVQIIRNISLQRPGFKVEDGLQKSDDLEVYKALDHHSMVALTSYVTSISMLRSCGFDPAAAVRKRKMGHLDEVESLDGGGLKFEGSSMDVARDSFGGRGRYKRRSGEARVEEATQLRDDGFAWRKYGQKTILNARHPRNYYRCTHKHEQKCLATKQVQQISETPTKYMIIYHGNHTCNHTLKANPIILDPPEEHSSAIFLSFDQPNQNNSNNTLLFPASSTFPVMEQEHEYIKQEMPSVSHDCSYSAHGSDQLSLLSENVSSSEDVTAITGVSISSTPVSEQSDVVSTAENFPCSTQEDLDDDYYSFMWADLELLHDL